VTISKRFQGIVIKTGDQVTNQRIGIELAWDPDRDPLAVTMTCYLGSETTYSGEDEQVAWVLSRELLHEGLSSFTPVGEGDVKLRLANNFSAGLLCCLTSPDGHADLALPLVEVEGFMDETEQHTPVGQEHFDTLLDDFLKEFEQ